MNCLRDVQPVEKEDSITVLMPDRKEIHLNYLHLQRDHRVHVFKALWGSLWSIGELCDAGLIAVFIANMVHLVVPISNKEEQHAVITASRTTTAVNCANSIVKVKKNRGKTSLAQGQANGASAQKLDNAGDRVEFFSRTFSSAAESTLMNAVK
jgi:hypothetical protein